MIASTSGRAGRFFIGAAGFAAAFTAAVALSQEEQGQEPLPPPRPLQLVPDQPNAPVEPAPDIAVGELAAPTQDTIGLVDARSGGFPGSLWRGSDIEILRKLLPQLPTRMTSAPQRRLAENLLLSAAPPPSSDGTLALSAVPSSWLLETRIERLAAMGAWDDVLAMIDHVPLAERSEAILKLRADALLVLNRTGEACGETQAALDRAPAVHWQKIQVFCHLTNGQMSAADFGLSLLREQGADDETFYWAVDVLRGNTPEPPDEVGEPTPLLLAMLRAAGVSSPDALIRSGDATTFGVLAVMPIAANQNNDRAPTAKDAEMLRAAAEAQILLAERAVAVGTLAPERLRALYRGLEVDLEDAPPLEDIGFADVKARARLFQSALMQTVPVARAEIIAQAIDIARADMGGTAPSLATVGLVYEPLLRGLSPSPDLAWFAGSAARGLMAAGEFEVAREWISLARSMSRTNAEAAQVSDGLWPIERLLEPGAKGRLPSRSMNAWAATVPEEFAVQGREILLNLYSAFGDPVTMVDWQPVLDGRRVLEHGPSIAPHIWHGLTLAARERRVGEAVALSLIALGDEGPGFASSATLQKVIATLMAVGRESDARALAVDAALALGL